MIVRRPRHAVTLVLAAMLAGTTAVRAGRQDQPGDSAGWQIPAGAGVETNPIQPTPAALAKGKDIYKAKCQRCHGVNGKGNGPDADLDHPPGDLADAKRASRNPDGVMYYKIWNGRVKPKMPMFKSEISKTDVWTVIQYVKTLRGQS